MNDPGIWRGLVIATVLAVFISAGSGCKKPEEGPGMGFSMDPVNVSVERTTIRETVVASGTVAANQVVDLKCKASGEIVSLPFDISDQVRMGDLVVELDTTDEERNVEVSQVNLSQAQANLLKAQQNLDIAEEEYEISKESAELELEISQLQADEARARADRLWALKEQGFAGQEECDAAETSARTAEANVERARISLEQLRTEEASLELRRQDVRLAQASLEQSRINLNISQQRLEDTKVYSPMDGVVTARNVQVGTIISSGISNTGGGTTILTISDLSKIYVLASVDESDIGRVVPGMVAEITADAFPGQKFAGVVERVAQQGSNVSNVVTFEVKIGITSDNKNLLMPEMTADVELVILEKADVLAVPVAAVSIEDGQRRVAVLTANGDIEFRNVEVGINNGELIEVTSGLKGGETLVIDEGSAESQWRSGFSQGMMRFGGRR
ncbi:MAG TPA: efflux RND transporter periplasmic adaptor subunit [bacterium]